MENEITKHLNILFIETLSIHKSTIFVHCSVVYLMNHAAVRLGSHQVFLTTDLILLA